MSAIKMCGQTSAKIDENKFSKAMYCLAPMHDNIVDALLKIMADMEPRSPSNSSRRLQKHRHNTVSIMDDDDGPRPMRNMKPVKRQRTGAERFRDNHHGEYEARGWQKEDRVSRVHVHNNAYPKMYDELDRRRSTTKITTKRNNNLLIARSRNFTLRKNTRKAQKTRGICKLGPRRKQTIRRDFVMKTQGCQYTYYPKKLVEKSVSTLDEWASADSPGPSNPKKKCCSKHEIHNINSKEKQNDNDLALVYIKTEKKSESELRNEKRSVASMSSYNSYMSMDHEPMDHEPIVQ